MKKYITFIGITSLLFMGSGCTFNAVPPVLKVPTQRNELNVAAGVSVSTGAIVGAQAGGSYNIVKHWGINGAICSYFANSYSRNYECGIHYNYTNQAGNSFMFAAFKGRAEGLSEGYGDRSKFIKECMFTSYGVRAQYEWKDGYGLSTKLSVLKGKQTYRKYDSFYTTQDISPQIAWDNTFYARLTKGKNFNLYYFNNLSFNSITKPNPAILITGFNAQFSSSFTKKK